MVTAVLLDRDARLLCRDDERPLRRIAGDGPLAILTAQRRIAGALIEDRRLYELWKESKE